MIRPQGTDGLDAYLRKINKNKTQQKTENVFSLSPSRATTKNEVKIGGNGGAFGSSNNYRPVSLDDYDSLVSFGLP